MVNTQNDITMEIKRRVLLANRCFLGLITQLRSCNISRQTKCKLYKTLIRSVLTYGSETWILTKSSEELLDSFERKVLRKICSAVSENGLWRKRYNHELYKDLDIIKTIKLNCLRWVGHVFRMKPEEPTRVSMVQVPSGQWQRKRPRLRFLDGVEEDLGSGVRRWRRKASDRNEWRGPGAGQGPPGAVEPN